MIHPDQDESDFQREGHSDATPGGAEGRRRPGETVFAAFLVLASLILMWQAWGIRGYRPAQALSWSGAIPLATSAVMVGTAALVLIKTARLPRTTDETLRVAVFPLQVVVLALMLVGYGVLLKPLGFLPTSALFLFGAIHFLSQRGVLFSLGVTLIGLIVVWLVFRIVFTVLMPPGIVPESEIIQVFRNVFSGGAR